MVILHLMGRDGPHKALSRALMTHVARRVPDQVGREGSVAVTGMVVGTEDVISHAWKKLSILQMLATARSGG